MKHIEDINAAIDYLTTLGFVDRDRIGALGVCAGGGFAVNATMVDRRIKAMGAVSAVNYGTMFRNGWDGHDQPEKSIPLLDMAAGQRTEEAHGAETGYLPTAPASVEEAMFKLSPFFQANL